MFYDETIGIVWCLWHQWHTTERMWKNENSTNKNKCGEAASTIHTFDAYVKCECTAHTHAYTQNVKSNFQHPARVSGYVSGYANECWFDICIHLTFNKQPSERTTEQMSTFYKAVQYKRSSSSYYFTWLNWAHHPSSLNAHCWVRAGKKNEMDFNLMNFSNLLCISSSTATVA